MFHLVVVACMCYDADDGSAQSSHPKVQLPSACLILPVLISMLDLFCIILHHNYLHLHFPIYQIIKGVSRKKSDKRFIFIQKEFCQGSGVVGKKV